MEPSQLIDALVRATGKSLLQVATEMAGASFQGTLYKVAAGRVRSPSRETALRISKYFKIPVDAVYDAAAASKVAADLGLSVPPTYAARAPVPPLKAAESEASYSVRPMHAPLFGVATEMRLRALTARQRKQLEVVITAYLDAVAPMDDGAKRSAQ